MWCITFFPNFYKYIVLSKRGKALKSKYWKAFYSLRSTFFCPLSPILAIKFQYIFLPFLFNESLYIYVVLDYLTYVCHYILDATLFGRRLAFSTKALSCVYIEILLGHLMRRYVLMLTMDLFIAIISLCITCFALGYTVGYKSNNKTQKWLS